MSTSRINHRFSLVGTLMLSAFSLVALALPLSTAKAQCLGVDLGIGCAGLGVGSWYTHPDYYAYPVYPGPVYPGSTYPGPTYYGYAYYGYPAYGYPSYSYPPESYWGGPQDTYSGG
jgi:hypothetical protein